MSTNARGRRTPPRTGGEAHPVGQDQEWRFICSPDRYQRLSGDQGFQLLVRLARHLNALRYSFGAVTGLGDAAGPIETRQRSATFIYQGGVLFEALALIPDLRLHFGTLKEWRSGFAGFGDDEKVRALIKSGEDLQRLRNHVSFHMLELVPRQSLPKLRLNEYVLASGIGPRGGGVYYDLADTVAAHYICGCPSDGNRFDTELIRIATETRDLAMRFLSAGDRLMAGALRHYRIRIKLGKRASAGTE